MAAQINVPPERSLDAYRVYVKSAVRRCFDLVARMSMGEFDPLPKQPSPAGDEFDELHSCLQVLSSDIQESIRDLESQYRLSLLRTELWRVAFNEYRSEKLFVQALLDVLGETLQVKRVSFYSLAHAQADAECFCQWCAANVEPTPGLTIPNRVWREIAVAGYAEIDRQFIDIPRHEQVRVLMERTGVGSIAGVLCGQPSQPVGFVILSEEREHRVWSNYEQQLLRELANIIAGKLAQMRAEWALHELNTRLESEVARRTRELSAANRAQEEELFRTQKLESLGLLAGGIAHDFNNVLTGIVSNLGLVRSSLDNRPELKQAVADAEEAALRATGLTRQLLTFARGGEPVTAPVSIRDMLESAVRFCLSGSRITYALSVSETLPPILADRGQIDQVLSNLLINAVQAMGVEGSITILARHERTTASTGVPQLQPGEYVRVTISDNGPGIAPQNRTKVFDPYYTTKRDGVGLGLSTVHSIIRRHGGMILCDEPDGGGASFTFFIPVARRREAPAARPRGGSIAPGTRVLVMDDEPTVRMVMQRLLRSAGCAVTTTAGPAEAIDAYREAFDKGERFDAVLLDLTIPGGEGGKETLQKLRALDPGVAAAVVSGYSNDPVMADYRAFGFKAMLAKPFRMSDLLHTVSLLMCA